MKQINKLSIMTTSIYIKQTGAGHYHVTVVTEINGEEVEGSFNTTDMQLIDDIKEMKSDGFECELVMHDTFEQVKETCLSNAGIDIPTKFYIMDKTSNSGQEFIDSDGNNCIEENAQIFYSEEEAQQVVDNNNWESWACVN